MTQRRCQCEMIGGAVGTGGGPTNFPCIRIKTDQVGTIFSIREPVVADGDFFRGATSLAFGRFVKWLYQDIGGGQFQQYVVLTEHSGTFVDAEDLELGPSSSGPWTDMDINTGTPVNQVNVDCDAGIGDPEEDPVLPDLETVPAQGNIPRRDTGGGVGDTSGLIAGEEGDQIPGVWQYDVTGGPIPNPSGGIWTGQSTGATAQHVEFIPGFPNKIRVRDFTLGTNGLRWWHEERIVHSDGSSILDLENPHNEVQVSLG